MNVADLGKKCILNLDKCTESKNKVLIHNWYIGKQIES